MATLKEFLEESELGAYQKVFPALTIPTIESQDAEGFLKAMALAAIEQVRYLETFSGIPLAVLYENIGQRHKASNLLAMSSFRKLPGGTGEGLGLIAIPGEEGGMYENLFLNLPTSDSPVIAEEQLSAMWSIQTEWIDAEISRLNSLLITLEKAETLELPDMSDETARGIWSTIITKITGMATTMAPVIGQVIAILEVADALITVGSFAYSIYQRFWVERETLRNLPQALIHLCKMTIDLLTKIREIPVSAANFEMRQSFVTNLTERFEQQLQFFMTGQHVYDTPAATTAGMEQLTAAIETLAYNDKEIDFGGVRVAMRSKLITEP